VEQAGILGIQLLHDGLGRNHQRPTKISPLVSTKLEYLPPRLRSPRVIQKARMNPYAHARPTSR
jgi:hypothetical protein